MVLFNEQDRRRINDSEDFAMSEGFAAALMQNITLAERLNEDLAGSSVEPTQAHDVFPIGYLYLFIQC